MSLFGKKEKEEIARLNAEMQSLRDAMPSESRTLDDINREIKDSREELARVQENLESRNSELKDALEELQQAKDQLIETNEEVLMQSFGLYTPRYSFMNADEYKAHLLEIRAKQKDMIKNKTAVSGNMNWTVNGNASKGKKMVSDMQKLLLRAFNSECDDVIEHVKYSNIDASEKRITASRDAISKLGTIMEVSIQPKYYRLKIEELHLAFEYAQKKQQEKEEQKEVRARMREEAKLAKEIEEERKKLEKEQQHYQNALQRINAQLEAASDADRAAIEEKKAELVAQLDEKEQQLQQLRAELDAKDIHISELDATINTLNTNVSSLQEESSKKTETINAQDKQLNTAWFVFGTKKELKEQRILDGDKVLESNFNKSYFTKIDIRVEKEIKFYSKSAKILTMHPSGSYTLQRNAQKQYVLRITNPQIFWSTSKYLVVVVK